MYRQSASRNHRSKGFKVKHVLQICVLVAVCFWLIYQVTRSINKNKEFDHNDLKISEDVQKDDEILKFGRKDLNPQVNKKVKGTEKHDEEVEEEMVEEEDKKLEEEIVEEEDKHDEEEDKHDEEEQKEDHETQKKEVESRKGGNDEEDEHNQERPDPDVDRKELIDDEKEKEEEGEKESEEKDIEDNDRQTETENSLEDHDHDKEIRNTREEHYKGDDVSSAVTHGLPANTENDNGSMENHVNTVDHENKGSITEESYVGQNTTDFKLQETTESGTLTVDEEKDDVDPTFEGSSSLNSTTASGSNDKPESSNDSIISHTSYSQNVTGGTVYAEGSNFQSLPLDQIDNSSIVVDNNSQLDSNLTTSNASENAEGNTTWPSNSVTDSHLVASEYSTHSNLSSETKDDSEAHTTEVKTDARTNGDYESSDSNNTENTDEVQHDNFDSSESSIPLDEKGTHIDLDTLPDIRTEEAIVKRLQKDDIL